MTTELEFHRLAALGGPLMEGAEFDELVADIKANGQREWILTYEGKILDGRNRYRACLAAGITPCVMEDDGRVAIAGGPTAYVVSANLHRRHYRRAHTAVSHPDWTKLHARKDALRITMKAFLKDLWV
jgi:hypothetical protein